MPKQNIQISEIYPNAINCTDVRFDWPIIELLGTKFAQNLETPLLATGSNGSIPPFKMIHYDNCYSVE